MFYSVLHFADGVSPRASAFLSLFVADEALAEVGAGELLTGGVYYVYVVESPGWSRVLDVHGNILQDFRSSIADCEEEFVACVLVSLERAENSGVDALQTR